MYLVSHWTEFEKTADYLVLKVDPVP